MWYRRENNDENSYKEFEEKYGYDPFIKISTFPTLIKLTEFIDGIQHCVTDVGEWTFDSNI